MIDGVKKKYVRQKMKKSAILLVQMILPWAEEGRREWQTSAQTELKGKSELEEKGGSDSSVKEKKIKIWPRYKDHSHPAPHLLGQGR